MPCLMWATSCCRMLLQQLEQQSSQQPLQGYQQHSALWPLLKLAPLHRSLLSVEQQLQWRHQQQLWSMDLGLEMSAANWVGLMVMTCWQALRACSTHWAPARSHLTRHSR